MGIYYKQMEDLITDVLTLLDKVTSGKIKFTQEAVDLLMLTMAHESKGGKYIKQIKGPALGVFQMEPLTHEDIKRYVNERRWLTKALESMSCSIRNPEELLFNLKYAIVLTRIHYYRKPEPLPKRKAYTEDIKDYYFELGKYAKQHYNTYLGKATAQLYYNDYLSYIGETE